MPSLTKIKSGYGHVFGFLSKGFMKGQPEYKDVKEISYLYKRVINHENVLDVNPEADVILCSDEWEKPNSVYKTLEDAQSHEDDTIFICDWKDDKGNVYYTCAYKDTEEGDEIQIVTRTAVFENLADVCKDVIDSKWHAVRLCFEEGECYVWESYPMDTFEFMEMYTSWVKRFGEWEHESSDDEGDDNTEDDESGSSTEDSSSESESENEDESEEDIKESDSDDDKRSVKESTNSKK